MSRFSRAAIAIVVAAGLTVPLSAGSVASALSPCQNSNFRQGDFEGTFPNADGVTAQIYVPSAAGIHVQSDTASDVYVFSGADFVQVGWEENTVANSSGWTSKVPVAFYGEYIKGATNNERLVNLGTLSTNTFHSFKMYQNNVGEYLIYVDGVYKGTTEDAHPTGSPAFNSEVDDSCTSMYGWVERNPVPPYLTLWYESGSTWHPWASDDDSAPVYYTKPCSCSYTITQISNGTSYQTGTAYALGGPS